MGVVTSQITSLAIAYSIQAQVKETSKLRVTGLCVGNSPGTPHKWPATRKMFPFDDVIMQPCYWFNRFNAVKINDSFTYT